jgi:single-stranded-DNA-specific exonuclease
LSESSVKLRRRTPATSVTLSANLPPLLQRIYLARGVKDDTELEKSARHLLPWQDLHGIHQACQLLYQALQADWNILVVGDFDADGATSTTLSLLALTAMGAKHIDYLIPNRFDDGYGLSPTVVAQAHAKNANLILTVDNGIASHAGELEAHRCGIKVVITDHHLPSDTLPVADAIVNPNLKDCQFPSRALAGVGVAFYLMLALRSYLRKHDWFSQRTEPNLAELLDLVALGTVADVVPLDANNRILVWQGIARIKAGKCRPGIRALLEVAGKNLSTVTAADLGFALGPRLNAAGRLDDMRHGVALLLTEDKAEARRLASELDALNQTRKEIEQGMQQEALILCESLIAENPSLPNGLAFYHPDWHQGVVGIVASRLKERFHRPVIAFAPAGNGQLKGSGRSINGLHLRDVLEQIAIRQPGLIEKYGGHAMAAGLMLEEQNFTDFQQQFAQQVALTLPADALQGVIWSDGELQPQEMQLATAELLRDAGPWGQHFPEPLFDGVFTVVTQKLLAGRHLKLLLELSSSNLLLDAIAFNIDPALWPDKSIRQIRIAYKLDINEFRGQRSLQLIIEEIWPDPT